MMDFSRFAGYRVRIRLEAGQARRRFSGVLVGFKQDQILLDVEGEDVSIDFSLVEQARLDLTLDEYLQLGKAMPPRVSDQEVQDAQ